MKRNMNQWLKNTIDSDVKKAIPVLSFPSIQLLNISVQDLIADGNLQAKGMKAIADRVDAAASLSMMDLSVEAQCFGSEIRFDENEVPTVIGKIVDTTAAARALKVPQVGRERTGIYIDAIAKATKLIGDRPVFAGVIGPFSLAGRLMDVSDTMIYCYENPEMVHTVLEKTTEFLTAYVQEYKKTGANGVVIAEPLAGILSPAFSREFSGKYVKTIVEAVQDEYFTVVYHNCGGSAIKTIDAILEVGAKAYHFGNAISMAAILPHIPGDKLVMGNVDPARQFHNGTPESVYAATLEILEACHQYPNFVISSGCDIPPQSSWHNIDAFFSAVKDFYDKLTFENVVSF